MVKGEFSKGDYSPVVAQIKRSTLMIRGAIDMEREMEIVGGIVNPQRVADLYYPVSRQLQETEDKLFTQLCPGESKKMDSLFGQSSLRWDKTSIVAKQMRKTLQQAGMKPAIVDCRAKSNFSIWQKLQRFHIEPSEVFDVIGVRIVTFDIDEAYHVRDELLRHYSLMNAHPFKKIEKIHQPIRDTLSNPKESKYAAIHMNFLLEENEIFETQISTRNAFIAMHREPDIPALSILSYK